jgi:hypothetical protein
MGMSENPEKRGKDSKKVAKGNIEQQQQPQPEPLDKQDPTEPVKVTGGREGKAMNITGSNTTVI